MEHPAQLAERLRGVTPYDLDKLAEVLEHSRRTLAKRTEDAGGDQ